MTNKNQQAWLEERKILIEDLTNEKQAHFITMETLKEVEVKQKENEQLLTKYEQLSNEAILERNNLRTQLEEALKKANVENKDDEVQEIQHKKIQELIEKNSNMEKELQINNDKMFGYLETITDLKQENENLKTSNKQAPTNLEKFIQTHKQESQDLKDNLLKTQQELDKANKKIEEQKKLIGNNNNGNNSNTNGSDEKILKYQQNEIVLNKKINEYTSIINDNNEEIKNLKSNADLLSNEVKILQEENEKIKNSHKPTTIVQVDNKHHEEEIMNLKNKVEEMKNKEKTFLQLNEGHIKSLEEKNKELNKILLDLDQARQKLNDTQLEVNALRESNNILKTNLNQALIDKENDSKKHKELNDSLLNEKRETEQKRQALESELFKKDLEIQSLMKQIPPNHKSPPSLHPNEISQSQTFLKSLQNEIGELKEKLQHSQVEIISLQNTNNSLSQKEKKANEDVVSIEKNNLILLEKIDSLQKHNQNLLIEKDNGFKQENQDREIHLQLKQRAELLEMENLKLKEKKQKLKSIVKEIPTNVKERDGNGEELRKAYSEIEKFKQMQSALKFAEQQNENLKKEKFRVEQSKQQVVDQFKQLRSVHEETVQELDQVCSEMVELYQENKSVKQLKSNNHLLSSQVEKLIHANKILQSKLDKSHNQSNFSRDVSTDRVDSINKMQKHILFIKNILDEDTVPENNSHSRSHHQQHSQSKNGLSKLSRSKYDNNDFRHKNNNNHYNPYNNTNNVSQPKNNYMSSSKFLNNNSHLKKYESSLSVSSSGSEDNNDDSSTSDSEEINSKVPPTHKEKKSNNINNNHNNVNETVLSNHLNNTPLKNNSEKNDDKLEINNQKENNHKDNENNTNNNNNHNHKENGLQTPNKNIFAQNYNEIPLEQNPNNTFSSFPVTPNDNLGVKLNDPSKTFHFGNDLDPKKKNKLLDKLASDTKALKLLQKKLNEEMWINK
eukprot:TRINITY_DN7580_c0_g1_i1.p1 TRINITY_DN7580_c0_g1~~TRINITY_DN7580_c0_g1_i1.p1  ORF type:complete len:957 (-),score=385.68 TRINITY_DN7580_c0_g1_i1:92-2962(-)